MIYYHRQLRLKKGDQILLQGKVLLQSGIPLYMVKKKNIQRCKFMSWLLSIATLEINTKPDVNLQAHILVHKGRKFPEPVIT